MNKMSNHRSEFDVRKSQLLTPFGIGALMDINNQSILIADSEYWDNQGETESVSDIRLEKALNANGLISPPIPAGNLVHQSEKITGKRFPAWYFSPTNRELKHIPQWREKIEKIYKNKKEILNQFESSPFRMMNNGKREELSPVRILCACSHGHLQEFPWQEWAHQDTVLSKSEFQNHELHLKSSGNSTSIGELRVECKQCGTKKSLAGIFDHGSMPERLRKLNVSCHGKYLWKIDDPGEKCDGKIQVLLRSQSNIYFPIIRSSVNIPFSSNNLLELISKHSLYNYILKELGKSENKKEKFNNNSMIDNFIKIIAEEMEIPDKKVRIELYKKFFKTKSEQNPETVMEYRRDEYDVLTGGQQYSSKSEIDFKIRIVPKSEYKGYTFSELFETITLADTLEVVSALTGYSRISTNDSEEMLSGEENEKNEVKPISLRRSDNRFVAVKAKGEGIFIELSQYEVNKWLKKVKDTEMIKRIYSRKKNVQFDDEFINIDPKFYLLHTLSHLLIKELTLTSGYSSSSLRERLYFSNESEKEMLGVLIYTSSGDSEGTLGGLVKQGLPQSFFKLLQNAIENTKWCSFDPVCIDSTGQGRNSLNIAACHACSLVSETSCEKMNVFLDRNVVVGNIDHPEWAFFI